MKIKDNVFFWIIFIVVLLISTVDLYFLIKFQSVIENEEKNIIGLWLIKIDSGSIALFSAIKMFGTCLSLMIYKKIFLKNKTIAYPIGFGILTFQIGLLIYLLFSN